LTKYTGPSTITKAGTVLNAMDITATLIIEAANVVITNSSIHGVGDEYAGVDVQRGSLTISDSTFSYTDNGLRGDNYTATRIEVTKLTSDGFKLGNNDHIDQAWCHDFVPASWAHSDCVQEETGIVNSSVTNSYLVGGSDSAIILKPDLGGSTAGPVLVNNNVLGNGNYTLYAVPGSNGAVENNVTITNNRFLHTGYYGPQSIEVPVTASNNTWIDTGQSIGSPLN